MEQGKQSKPAILEYLPVAQGVHKVEPAAEKVPAGHGMQEACAVESVYRPAWHDEQVSAPPVE